MKIDGYRRWTNKDGIVQFDVVSFYITPKAEGYWLMTGRWLGEEPPSLGQSVRYIQGKYGFLALPARE